MQAGDQEILPILLPAMEVIDLQVCWFRRKDPWKWKQSEHVSPDEDEDHLAEKTQTRPAGPPNATVHGAGQAEINPMQLYQHDAGAKLNQPYLVAGLMLYCSFWSTRGSPRTTALCHLAASWTSPAQSDTVLCFSCLGTKMGSQTHTLSQEVTKQLRHGQRRSATYNALDQRRISGWERHWWVFSQVRQKEMKEQKRHKDNSKIETRRIERAKGWGRTLDPTSRSLKPRKRMKRFAKEDSAIYNMLHKEAGR